MEMGACVGTGESEYCVLPPVALKCEACTARPPSYCSGSGMWQERGAQAYAPGLHRHHVSNLGLGAFKLQLSQAADGLPALWMELRTHTVWAWQQTWGMTAGTWGMTPTWAWQQTIGHDTDIGDLLHTSRHLKP